MMPITLLYACLLGAFFFVLSARVIFARRSTGISLGSGEDVALQRRVRAHANFVEYTPLCLLIMGLIEATGGAALLLHVIGLLLLLGRLAHGIALSFSTNWPMGRMAGTALTFASLIVAIATGLITTIF